MLTLSRHSLAECRAQMLVCGCDQSGRVDSGALGSLLQQAGPELEPCLKAGLAGGSREPGALLLTPAFQLRPAAGVEHLALVIVRPCPTPDQLRQAAHMLSHLVQSLKLRSLACMALGCGAGLLPPAQAARALLEPLLPQLKDGLELELALPRLTDFQAYHRVGQQLRLCL